MNFTSIPDVQLGKREREVLKLVLQSKGNKQIALALAPVFLLRF